MAPRKGKETRSGGAFFTSYGGVFARNLVLPSLGFHCPEGGNAEQWDLFGAKLIRPLWAERFEALERQLGEQAPLPRRLPTLGAARFCRNVFSREDRGQRYCNMVDVCPSCYVREHFSVWRKLQAVLFKSKAPPQTRAKQNLLIWDYQMTWSCPLSADNPQLRFTLEKTLKTCNLWAPPCVACNTMLAPQPSPATSSWTMHLLGIAVQEPPAMFYETPRHRVRVVERPTQMDLAKATAEAFAYPAWRMFGEVRWLAEFLDARTKLRLRASYGLVRGSL